MGKKNSHALPLIFMAVLLGLILLGCAGQNMEGRETKPVEPVPEPPPLNEPKVEKEVSPPREPDHIVHTVKWPGESLSIIAAWYTGDYIHWEKIAEANPDVDPNRIYVGNKILIPGFLCVTRAPMPKDHVVIFRKRMRQEKTTPDADAEASHENDQEPELFGPKTYPDE